MAIFNFYHVLAPFVKLRGGRFLYFFSLCDVRNKAVFLLLEHSSLRGVKQKKTCQNTSDKIPTTRTAYRTRNKIGNIPRFNVKHNFFKNSFFPSSVIGWNNLDKSIRSSESLALFKKSILQFIQSTPNRTFNCHNHVRLKLITRLRLVLSYLRKHKFKQFSRLLKSNLLLWQRH